MNKRLVALALSLALGACSSISATKATGAIDSGVAKANTFVAANIAPTVKQADSWLIANVGPYFDSATHWFFCNKHAQSSCAGK